MYLIREAQSTWSKNRIEKKKILQQTEDFNAPFSIMDRLASQKINKETENNILIKEEITREIRKCFELGERKTYQKLWGIVKTDHKGNLQLKMPIKKQKTKNPRKISTQIMELDKERRDKEN